MTSLALKLIEKNKRNRSPFLDLGNCGLTEIPAELADHDWLIVLSLGIEFRAWDEGRWHKRTSNNAGGHNQIRNIEILAKLSSLQGLYLSGNPVRNIQAIASLHGLRWLSLERTHVGGLTVLRNLQNLEWLDISYGHIDDLHGMERLKELQELIAYAIPARNFDLLCELSSLRHLDLSATLFFDLSPLRELQELRSLNLDNTRVTDIFHLTGLQNLEEISLSNLELRNCNALAALSKLNSIDLSGTKISEINFISSLPLLKKLSLARTSVSRLDGVECLQLLQDLDISNTTVSDLSLLTQLNCLRKLNLANTPITSIDPLSNLTRLEELNLASTPIVDLAQLAELRELRVIIVADTRINDLGPLMELGKLEHIDAKNSGIMSVAGFENLNKLKHLNIWGTKVRDLYPLRGHIEKGLPIHLAEHKAIFVRDKDGVVVFGESEEIGEKVRRVVQGILVGRGQLISPPPEIVGQGNSAILNFFKELASDEKDYLYEAKLLILGEGGAGKTSLFRRLFQPGLPLPKEDETTRGISIYRHEFTLRNGRLFRLNVWDFGGQEIYHATHQFFLTQRSLYLLLDDTRKDDKSVSDPGFRYWLDMIDILSSHSPVLIFQNEKSGRSKIIDFAGIKKQYDNVKERYAGNLEHANSVDKFREGVEFYASNLEHIGEELPARWIRVRSEIEARAEEVPYISSKEYFEIYRRHILFDREKALHLSHYLHDLGVFLHFQNDELLSRIIILQNAWATEAVFRVLDDEIIKSNLGRFGLDDCERLWHDGKYAEMHPELMALMQRFELCYLLPDSSPKKWLAPQLLPPARPKILAEWGQPGDLVVRYLYDFMPKGLISRLTVRLHRFVRHPDYAYVTGVLFEQGATRAFVELLSNGREIEIRARGIECKALLSVISADLEALNASFQGLETKVEKRIPCICAVCARSSLPELFSHRNLLKRLEDKRLTVECQNSYEQIEVQALLDGVKGDIPQGWTLKQVKPRLKRIKIFLASSSELKAERDEFDLFFRQHNDLLINDGVYLEIVRWENFLDAMSETRLQDEYNETIRTSDIFVSLFFTKTGKFTEEEFDTAHEQFNRAGRPYIYTFFKNAEITTGSAIQNDLNSLWLFQKKLDELGHFYTCFKNVDDLKLQFQQQLRKLLEDRL